MAKLFKTAFAYQGTKEQLPDAAQPDGKASFAEGFTEDYTLDYGDADARDIAQSELNGILHDITEAVGELQKYGVAVWQADMSPIAKYSLVFHGDKLWQAKTNTSTQPAQGANWQEVDIADIVSQLGALDLTDYATKTYVDSSVQGLASTSYVDAGLATKATASVVNAQLAGKFDKTDIVQAPGQSTTKVMSQKAVTDAIAASSGGSGAGGATIKGTWTPQVTYDEGYPLVNQINLDGVPAELLVEGSKVTRLTAGGGLSGMATNADVAYAEKSVLYFKMSAAAAEVESFASYFIALINSAQYDESLTAALFAGLVWSTANGGELTLDGVGNTQNGDKSEAAITLPMTQAEFVAKTWALCFDSSIGNYGEVSVYDTDVPDTPIASYQLQQDIGNPLCAVLVTPNAWDDTGIAPSSVEIIHEPANPIVGFTTLKIGGEATLSFDGVTANNAYVVAGETGASFGLHDGDIAFINDTGDGIQQVIKQQEEPDLTGYATKAWVENKGYVSNAQIDTDETLSSDRDDLIPSQKAVKAYVDAQVPSIEGAVQQAENAADRAEAASDSAFVNADVYPTVADGRAAVADGEQFQVVEDDEIVRYRRDSETVATEVARFPSADVAGALPQNIRTADFLTRPNFVSGEISGTFAAYNDVETSTPLWEVSGGALVVTGPFSGDATRCWRTGHAWHGRGALKISLSGKMTTTANNRGLSCYIGSTGGARVHFGYTRNGLIGAFVNTGAQHIARGGVANVPAMVWGENETATLNVGLYPDGSGYVEAIHPSGQRYRHTIHSVVERGSVGPSWQRSDEGEITVFEVYTVDTDDRIFKEIDSSLADLQASINPAHTVSPLDISSRDKISTEDTSITDLIVRAVEDGTTLKSTSGTGMKGVLTGVQAAPGVVAVTFSTTGGVGQVVGLAIDAEEDSQWLAWGASGGVVRYDNAGQVATVLRSSDASREWVSGGTLRFSIGIRDDRSCYVVLERNEVFIESVDVDVPAASGEIAVAIGRTATYTVNSLYIGNGIAPRLDSLGDRVTALENQAGLGGVKLLDFSVIPDFPSDGSRPVGTPGFTCTGLARVTRGIYAGCWLVGDDGRIVESESSPYNPHVHLMDMSMRRIIRSFPMPYSGASVQGIAVDTSGSADTFWVATAGDGKLRHFDMDGVEIVGDQFIWDHANWGGNPNGLCYVPSLDALWCSPFTGNTSRLIACDPSAPDRVISTMETTQRVDHSQIIESENKFYYTPGSSSIANDDIIIAKDLTTGVETALYTLPRSKSLEGFFIDRSNGRLYGVSDAGYHHAGAAPALNLAFVYSVPAHSVE